MDTRYALAMGMVFSALTVFACGSDDDANNGTSSDPTVPSSDEQKTASSSSSSGALGGENDKSDNASSSSGQTSTSSSGGGGATTSTSSGGTSTSSSSSSSGSVPGSSGEAPPAVCGDGSVKETESNDTPETANDLGSAASFCGSLPSATDVDHVSFTLPADAKSFSWRSSYKGYGKPELTITAEGVTRTASEPPPFFPGKRYVLTVGKSAEPVDYVVTIGIGK